MIDDTFVLCMELYVPNAGQLFLIYDYKKKIQDKFLSQKHKNMKKKKIYVIDKKNNKHATKSYHSYIKSNLFWALPSLVPKKKKAIR